MDINGRIDMAILDGDYGLVETLLQTDPNIYTKNNMLFAAQIGNIKIYDLLFKYGLNSQYLMDALYTAIESGQEEMIKFIKSNKHFE